MDKQTPFNGKHTGMLMHFAWASISLCDENAVAGFGRCMQAPRFLRVLWGHAGFRWTVWWHHPARLHEIICGI